MVDIVGAGLAGLLAANILHRHQPRIYEAQNELPNNHHAILRFRSSVVGDTLGIPFKCVNMLKCSAHWGNPVSDALAYSYKCTGLYRSDRSLPIEPVSQERFIAPPDLIARMAKGQSIIFNHPVNAVMLMNRKNGQPIISTMPMPNLMDLLDYKAGHLFDSKTVQGTVISARVSSCDAYVSVYVPDPGNMFSRVSITGSELIAEVPKVLHPGEGDLRFWSEEAAKIVGLPIGALGNIELRRQKYFKILGIDDNERKKFIHWATDKYNVYSLGRFATWRPGLLLDDLVNDIRLIDHWICNDDLYQLKRDRI